MFYFPLPPQTAVQGNSLLFSGQYCNRLSWYWSFGRRLSISFAWQYHRRNKIIKLSGDFSFFLLWHNDIANTKINAKGCASIFNISDHWSAYASIFLRNGNRCNILYLKGNKIIAGMNCYKENRGTSLLLTRDSQHTRTFPNAAKIPLGKKVVNRVDNFFHFQQLYS